MEGEKSPTVGGDDGGERYQSVLYHFLFLTLLNNIVIINPGKCGFISPSLGVRMKCELIGQVYSVAEITKAWHGDAEMERTAKA